MTDLDTLIARLEALTEPDRMLSADICNSVLGEKRPYWDTLHVTASIDAAVALVERVLPGWSWECRASGTGDKGQATVWNPSRAPGSNWEQRAFGCATPAIALCIATLRALQAREVDGQ